MQIVSYPIVEAHSQSKLLGRFKGVQVDRIKSRDPDCKTVHQMRENEGHVQFNKERSSGVPIKKSCQWSS